MINSWPKTKWLFDRNLGYFSAVLVHSICSIFIFHPSIRPPCYYSFHLPHYVIRPSVKLSELEFIKISCYEMYWSETRQQNICKKSSVMEGFKFWRISIYLISCDLHFSIKTGKYIVSIWYYHFLSLLGISWYTPKIQLFTYRIVFSGWDQIRCVCIKCQENVC